MQNERASYNNKRSWTEFRYASSSLIPLLALTALLFAGQALGAVYHVYMNPNSGTTVNCSSLPPKDQWWAYTFHVDNQAKFDCLVNYVLGQGTLVNGKPVDELQIHIEAGSSGSYYTTLGIKWGFASPNTWDVLKIYGSGTPKPTIRLVNRFGFGDYLQMFELGWIRKFEMKNLTLDCQWTGGAPSLYSPYYKTGGLSVLCFGGALVDNVTVTNFGSKGAGASPVTGSGTEAFALNVLTADFGQQDTITIQNCEVHSFYPLDGGYCTGINVVTWFGSDFNPTPNSQLASNCSVPPPPGTQRPQSCVRPSPVAYVLNNYVHDLPSGIALGAANAEFVRYQYNRISDCNSGFNCDTADKVRSGYDSQQNPILVTFLSRNVEILDNSFTNCYRGINVGMSVDGSTRFTNFTISGNKFINLLGWFKNPREPKSNDEVKYPLYSECWGIQLNGANSGFTITNNRFSASTTAFWCVSSSLHSCGQGYNIPQNFLYGPLPTPINYWFPIRIIQGNDNYLVPHYQPGTHTIQGNKLMDEVTSVDTVNQERRETCTGGTHTGDVCD